MRFQKLLFFFSLILSLQFVQADEDCVIIQEQNFGAIGDTSGKDIYTKVEYTYECNTTTMVKGECAEWRVDSNRHMALPEDKPVVFKDEDFSGGLGQLALIFAGYSQLDHIWSGWKGICYDGVLEDFSWMSDPFMWASLIAQAMGADAKEMKEFSEYAGYAQCAVQMGAAIGSAVQNYTEDEIPCDPIDEFCGDENEDSDENVMSVTKEAYDNLVADNPSYSEYIDIVDQQGDIYIIKIVQPIDDTAQQAAAEAAEAMEEIKQIMLAIESAFIAYDAYSCFSAAGDGTQNIGGSSNDTNPVQKAITGGVSRAIAATGCVPCSIAFTLAVNLVNSFNDVDTCNDKDDAQEQGTRHIATYAHKTEDMCHFIRKKTEEGIFTELDKFFYCCYDDVFSRILAEQVKAQYAKDWSSCSDITLKEVINIKMTPCSEGMLGVDPETIAWDASYEQRQEAIQYRNKCIDFSELKAYLSEKFNANIDEGMIYEQLEDIQSNIEE